MYKTLATVAFKTLVLKAIVNIKVKLNKLINVTLKMHEKNPDWFRDDKKNADKMKKKGKTQPKKEIKTQYLGSVEIIEPQLNDDGGSKVANNNPIVVGFD